MRRLRWQLTLGELAAFVDADSDVRALLTLGVASEASQPDSATRIGEGKGRQPVCLTSTRAARSAC